ncbi:hypothetical protein [Neobacillus sp. D3-1R]|uniref:hypothetical protein n=1 Tax=Neobacillus sp. D3-1R TaxID=3445778 RepID=UPI003F9F0BD9
MVDIIKIDIGILPQSYVSDKPEDGGYIPYAIDGKTPYLYDVHFLERNDARQVEEFVSKWMEKLNPFPIYAFFECYDFQQKEMEEEYASNSIDYTKSKWNENDYYNKVVIRNIDQFNVIFPYLYGNGSMNNFACLSLKKDVYSIEFRDFVGFRGENINVETPILTLIEDTTVIWVNYDGNGLVLISNDHRYSQLDFLIKTLPENTNYSISEFGE